MSNRRKRRPDGQHRHHGGSVVRWTADDALRVRDQLCDWLRTPNGAAEAEHAYLDQYKQIWPEVATDVRTFGREHSGIAAELLERADLIWCDPPMVALLTAASDTFPEIPVEPQHIPAPFGIVIFSEPVPALWNPGEEQAQQLHNLSAITWIIHRDANDDGILVVSSWIRAHGTHRVKKHNRPITYRHLRIRSVGFGHFGAPESAFGGLASPGRLLQTLTALLRSPLVKETTHTASAGPRSSTIQRPNTLRRIQLRRPEHGEAELQAARGARNTRHYRGHWVRGHWKQQWFPSVGENRALWIQGYPRGDFALGAVTGPKVLIATDTRAPADELNHAS